LLLETGLPQRAAVLVTAVGAAEPFIVSMRGSKTSLKR